jgi:hypothetical protein
MSSSNEEILQDCLNSIKASLPLYSQCLIFVPIRTLCLINESLPSSSRIEKSNRHRPHIMRSISHCPHHRHIYSAIFSLINLDIQIKQLQSRKSETQSSLLSSRAPASNPTDSLRINVQILKRTKIRSQPASSSTSNHGISLRR